MLPPRMIVERGESWRKGKMLCRYPSLFIWLMCCSAMSCQQFLAYTINYTIQNYMFCFKAKIQQIKCKKESKSYSVHKVFYTPTFLQFWLSVYFPTIIYCARVASVVVQFVFFCPDVHLLSSSANSDTLVVLHNFTHRSSDLWYMHEN